MKRFFALLLALTLVLTGCSRQQTISVPVDPPSADEVARAVLAVCEDAEAEAVTGDELTLWLTEFYRLPEHSWDDAAIYRAADPMYAFEIAVIRLSEGADSMEVMYRLEDYQYDREGDFFGYDPEQAALVANALVCCSDNLLYAALLICENPMDAADTLSQAAAKPSTAAPPVSTATPTAPITPQPTATPSSAPATPPIEHMMDIYDTSAIIEAWHSGDDSALSAYDRAILGRCRQILSDILEKGMTDLEKEQAIYLWVTRHVAYDYDHYDKLEGASLDSSTPYNPLIKGKGICMGFATTFQLLADLAGLESIIVPGRAFNNSEDHAWNMIRLNGQWYCLDATWDEMATNPRLWSFFNVPSRYMKDTNHQWDYDAYPTATATDGGVR